MGDPADNVRGYAIEARLVEVSDDYSIPSDAEAGITIVAPPAKAKRAA